MDGRIKIGRKKAGGNLEVTLYIQVALSGLALSMRLNVRLNDDDYSYSDFGNVLPTPLTACVN